VIVSVVRCLQSNPQWDARHNLAAPYRPGRRSPCVAENQAVVRALRVKTAFAEQAGSSGSELHEATQEVMTRLAGTAVPTEATRLVRDP
jgi:hypothetical protein